MDTRFGEQTSLPTTERTHLVGVVEMEDNLRGFKGLNERILSYTQKSWEI